MFSHRLDWELQENALTRRLREKRAAGEPVCDLTISNPTQAELRYPGPELLACLAPEEALVYDPSPEGLLVARRAVAAYYEARGCAVAPESIVLTSSTSEAYGYLFKLLGDPGDDVLVPSPSYPLFTFLAALEGVRARPYLLRDDDEWRIDFRSLESSLTGSSRALLAVHPNNPTGSFVAADEADRLRALARRHDLALLVDEVFLDYPLDEAPERATSFAAFNDDELFFVLGGLSKLAGLPQLKLAWIVVGGRGSARDEARLRLEHIADNYLTVATPVQWALPRILELAPRVTEAISRRVRENRKTLADLARSEPAVSLPRVAGGWSQPARLPAVASSEAWAEHVLEASSLYIHPGSLFGFAKEAYVVLSLLTPPALLDAGARELFACVTRRLRL